MSKLTRCMFTDEAGNDWDITDATILVERITKLESLLDSAIIEWCENWDLLDEVKANVQIRERRSS